MGETRKWKEAQIEGLSLCDSTSVWYDSMATYIDVDPLAESVNCSLVRDLPALWMLCRDDSTISCEAGGA